METMREIWPDMGEGDYIEIGPDREGAGCVEIRQKEPDGKISARITMTIESARLVAKAVALCADDLSNTDSTI